MLRRIIFILLWALAFYFAAAFLVGMVIGFLIGFTDFFVDDHIPQMVVALDALILIGAALGLFFGVKGFLPGTRKPVNSSAELASDQMS